MSTPDMYWEVHGGLTNGSPSLGTKGTFVVNSYKRTLFCKYYKERPNRWYT